MFSAIIAGLKLANWLNWIVAIVLTGFFALLLADAGGVRAEILAGRSEASREATRLYLYTVLSIVPPTAIAVHMLLTRLVALVRDAAAGMAFTTANAATIHASITSSPVTTTVAAAIHAHAITATTMQSSPFETASIASTVAATSTYSVST